MTAPDAETPVTLPAPVVAQGSDETAAAADLAAQSYAALQKQIDALVEAATSGTAEQVSPAVEDVVTGVVNVVAATLVGSGLPPPTWPNLPALPAAPEATTPEVAAPEAPGNGRARCRPTPPDAHGVRVPGRRAIPHGWRDGCFAILIPFLSIRPSGDLICLPDAGFPCPVQVVRHGVSISSGDTSCRRKEHDEVPQGAAVVAGSLVAAGSAAPAFAYDAADITPTSLNGAVNALTSEPIDVMPLEAPVGRARHREQGLVLHTVKGATTDLNSEGGLLGGLPLGG
ncbi:hypothetical protein LV779_18560 [Streptomyces thinghirensis]|nr:hypothetical protein [Streptomyces thinghirensis]